MVATESQAQGSSLRHLAMILFGNRDLARCNLAAFTAYFDASGSSSDHHSGAVLFVSGFVATAQAWLDFEEEWRAFLAGHDLCVPFHMTDFEAGGRSYGKWKGKYAERQKFIAEATKIIKVHTLQAFSHGVVIEDFRRMFSEYEIPENQTDEPYPWCALNVCGKVLDWAERGIEEGSVQPTDKLEFVFEAGDLYRGKFLQFAKERYGFLPVLKEKANKGRLHGEFPPFDAGDILAWEHRHFVGELARGFTNPYGPRQSLVNMVVESFPGTFTFQRWDRLEADCIRHGLRRRESTG